jgi:Transposase
MLLIGVDYHPSFQMIAFFDEETGECGEQELNHSEGQAERFYRGLQQRGIRVRVGMEATGYSRWFERLLAELGIEIWMGDPAEIKAKRVKKRKTDRNDALLLLRLLRENNFPQIWVQRTGTSAVRETRVGSLGQSAPVRVAGVAGSHESDDSRADGRGRAGSQQATRGSAADDASWRGSAYSACLCVDHRNSGAVSTRQADRHLRGNDSV